MRSFTVYISEIVSWWTSFWWCKASTASSFVFFHKHETLKKKSINIFFHFNFDCLFSPSVTTVHCCTNIVQSHLLPKQKYSGCEWYKIILLNIFLFLGITNLILLSRDWMVSCLLKHLTRKIKSKVPNGLDNSRQVTIFNKWTTTLSLKQDMFRSSNDHLQLWIRLQVRLN